MLLPDIQTALRILELLQRQKENVHAFKSKDMVPSFPCGLSNIERVAQKMSRGGVIRGVRGRHGGYRIDRKMLKQKTLRCLTSCLYPKQDMKLVPKHIKELSLFEVLNSLELE